ncbi:MAG: aminoacyl-tRNA hydrolase [Anaerolineales bacterium]|nr:aminoacyl-tRNA hydrolase [Anaerolineales bacterium]
MIVGLGNPGREYRLNRHNLGFMALDEVAERFDMAGFTRKQGRALYTTGQIHEQPVILVKPQTYMNLSGEAVGSLMRFYNIAVEKLLVCVDDLAIPFGTLRLRPRGSAGGQRGLQSIVNVLGSDRFARLRLGIGRPPGQLPSSAYVLQNFDKDEFDVIELVLARAVDVVASFVKDGVVLTMSRYNGPADREG